MSKACDFYKLREILIQLEEGKLQFGSDKEFGQLCGFYAEGVQIPMLGAPSCYRLHRLTDAGFSLLDALRDERAIERIEQYAQSRGQTLTVSNFVTTSINANAALQQLVKPAPPAPQIDRKIEKRFCGHCQKETRSIEVWDEEKTYDSKEYDMWVSRSITITQCLGCDEYTITTTEFSSENRDYNGDFLPTINILYPPQPHKENPPESSDLALHTKITERQQWLPTQAFTILHESITARTNHLDLLSMVGLRMAIDACCQDAKKNQVITKAKRDEFLNNGMLSKKQHSMLEQIVDSANEAAHQFVRYSDEDFAICLEGVLACLDSVYHTEYLSRMIPEASNNRR